jgi:hypothetical protein
VQGAFATASPGGQWARRALMEPVRDRVYFAGEAVHETLWGTVGGAWESGARAAEAVVRRLAGLPEAVPAMPPKAEPQASAPQRGHATPKPETEAPRGRSRRRPRRQPSRSRRQP